MFSKGKIIFKDMAVSERCCHIFLSLQNGSLIYGKRNGKYPKLKPISIYYLMPATALSRLPKVRREVLLLYYFIGYRDEAIGRLYGRCRSSINRRRNVALKQLRKEWEKLEHEEQKADTF